MRPLGSPKLLENRRRKAILLLDTGLSLHEVSRKIGCHPSSVMRWRDTRSQSGENGLKPKPVPGRPPKLSVRQKGRLIKILLKGALANGYRTDLWTTARIAEVIRTAFGISYHRDHVGRLMAGIGWSYQKPARQSLKRNDAAIDQWKRTQWPRIKKTPSGWAPISSS